MIVKLSDGCRIYLCPTRRQGSTCAIYDRGTVGESAINQSFKGWRVASNTFSNFSIALCSINCNWSKCHLPHTMAIPIMKHDPNLKERRNLPNLRVSTDMKDKKRSRKSSRRREKVEKKKRSENRASGQMKGKISSSSTRKSKKSSKSPGLFCAQSSQSERTEPTTSSDSSGPEESCRNQPKRTRIKEERSSESKCRKRRRGFLKESSKSRQKKENGEDQSREEAESPISLWDIFRGFWAPSKKPRSKKPMNQFKNASEIHLEDDMAYIARQFKLDKNAQLMLAYYDARSLEDFCLMSIADVNDMIQRAKEMERALPPLQIRKIRVLREWVQELADPQDNLDIPAWVRISKSKRIRRKKGELIPSNWKSEFKKDLPDLKEELQKRADDLSFSNLLSAYLPTFQSFGMCGYVQ